MEDLASAREQMVQRQIVARGIDEPALLAAFRAVPREAFVSPEQASRCYGDHPLPIGDGQTISQPYIVALMIDSAGVGLGDQVLEVGAGSGYAAALLGHVADRVVAIERHAALAEQAAERIERLGYGNVRIIHGDGSLGAAGDAPFDVILVSAGGPQVPDELIAQLKPGGRLVMPVGGARWFQTLVKLTKREDGRVERERLAAVSFVPLVMG
jgi:protein-L-isoaspartate(D-aspartate) O-methyltransferase